MQPESLLARNPSPAAAGLAEIRQARDDGCLRDVATEPFKPRLPFERGRQTSPRWWNGLIYSRYQLLALPSIEGLLDRQPRLTRGKYRLTRVAAPHSMLVERMARLRKTVLALTALEARYLPKLDPEFIHLTNAEWQDWESYREQFDPVFMQTWLQYPADEARRDAEEMLSRASRLDPMGRDWSQLIRRAPAKAREDLKDAVLQAMDLRIASEILLLFYEDLVARDQAEPLPDVSTLTGWSPLAERLSYRARSLDENLVTLGISPHPRVVLALEGETEMYHAPRIQAALEFTGAPELLRLLKLGAANRELVKVAALAAAPLVSDKVPGTDAWRLIKPYTKLFVAVDPDAPFTTPGKVASERAKILDEIKDVLKAQGVEHPNPVELDHLVEIRTWDAPCYEFAHFTDEELADGIMAVHHTINSLTRDELIASLARSRSRGKDVKEVWSRWEYKVSKVKLAEALWPTLLEKIRLCMTTRDAPVPPLASVINDAYHVALQWRDQSYVLTETPDAVARQQRA